MSRVVRVILVVFSFGLQFVLVQIPAFAQTSSSTGAIVGVVRDAHGAAVPNAKVSVSNAGLGITRETTSKNDGGFVVPLLSPHAGYSVTVVVQGFETWASHDVEVLISEVSSLDVRMTIGHVTEQVTVTSEGMGVETTNPSLGGTLPSEAIQNLPLPTRNVVELLATDAGVAATISSPSATVLQGSTATFVGGQRDTDNNYMVNGIDANNFEFHTLGVGIIPVPNPDSVQEFRTVTSLQDATVGFNSGGNISLITRSGTSKFHGTGYEYLRNSVLNANDFFFNLNGTPRPELIQNQFGASIGGPVPKMQGTFFFFNYEGQRQKNGITGGISGLQPVLPSTRDAATLAGIYDVPVNAIDPVAINYLNAKGPYGGLLIPSGTGAPVGTMGNFSFSTPVILTGDQYNARVDHNFNLAGKANNLFVSYFSTPVNFLNPGGANGMLGQPYQYLLENDTFAIHDTMSVRPNLLNEVSVGYTFNQRDIQSVNPLTLSDVGMSRFNSSILDTLPNITFEDGELNCCGASTTVGETQHNESFDARDMVSWLIGKHSVRMGFEARTQQLNYHSPVNQGTIDFTGRGADMLYGAPSNPSVDTAFRDFLVGAPDAVSDSSGLLDYYYRAHDFGVFVQDDFRVAPRLTLNLGLRWDYIGNVTERYGNISNFDPSRLDANTLMYGGAGLKSGFIIPAENKSGTPGVSNSTLGNQPFDLFGPRVGFAYDVFGNGKMAVRGGYGIYYQRLGGLGTLQTSGNPPFALSAENVHGVAGFPWQGQLLANPFPTLPLPSAFPIFPQMPALLGLNSDGSPNYDVNTLSGGVVEIDPRDRQPSTQQWNLTVQTQLYKNWMVQIGYAGTHSLHQLMTQSTNNALLRNSNNPGPFGLAVNSAANVDSRVPVIGLPDYGISDLTTNGKTFYDALLLTVSHRFSQGLYFKAAYTWSKTLDNVPNYVGYEPGIGSNGNQFIPDLNYGLSNYNIPQRLIVSYVYDLPGPKHGVSSYFIGNWEVAGITTLQSGTSGEIDQFSLTSLTGTSGYGIVLPGCQLVSSGSVSDHISNYLNSSCVTTQPTLTAGQTFGPLSPLAGPGNQMYTIDPALGSVGQLMGTATRGAFQNPFQTREDLALKKTFPLHALGEQGSVQFIAQAFKLFNTPIFSGSSTTANFSSLGHISSTIDNTGRQLQFALRVNF
ncbi:MAG TPA: TonB-dependent receptor [Candidatus Polarisedimenticolia bacterium]|nr:TonB-dependent receptor [Candidatus Polarisedimenticolia bacterium]